MNNWNLHAKDLNTSPKFDFLAPFDEQIKSIKTDNGGTLKKGSHSYWVLLALFRGYVIDDYENAPYNDKGRRVRNVRSRISDLRYKYNIAIEDRVTQERYKEYRLYGRGAQ